MTALCLLSPVFLVIHAMKHTRPAFNTVPVVLQHARARDAVTTTPHDTFWASRDRQKLFYHLLIYPARRQKFLFWYALLARVRQMDIAWAQ